MGCSADDILKCFEKHKLNKSGEIVNSPFSKIDYNKSVNQQNGFWYNKDGHFVGLNENIFVKYFLRNYNLAYNPILGYYHYSNNHWLQRPEFEIKSMMYNFFDKHEPNEWHWKLEESYIAALPYNCKKTDNLPVPKNYINVRNGLLNLTTFEIEKHDDKLFTTVQLPVEYDKNSCCPMFIKFLKDVLFDDMDMVKLIQEIFGYCLSYETKAQKFFILFGDGANGKSVLCDILFELAGGENHVSTVALKDLERPFALSQIVGKTLNLATENEVKSMDTATLKAIASGDPKQLEKKFKDPFTYRPFAKLVFSVNRMPYLNDKSYGIERRLIVIPFDKRFVVDPVSPSEGKKIVGLTEHLLTELDGIFNFAMEGYKRLKKNKFEFTESAKVNEILEEYKLEINPYLEFTRDCIFESFDLKKEISAKTLNDIFVFWCIGSNRKKMAEATMRTFLRELRLAMKNERISFGERKSNGELIITGIEFTSKGEKLQNIFQGNQDGVRRNSPKNEKGL
jgi:putative DNA primase/helicase